MTSYPNLSGRAPRLVFALALLIGLAACGDSQVATEDERECDVNADCAAGERCSADGSCVADMEPPEPECVTDADCERENGEGWACNDSGGCYECEQEDPAQGFAEAPSTWDPDSFVAGEDVGLDPGLAYLVVSPDDHALNGDVQRVIACGDVFAEGEVVETDVCTTWDAEVTPVIGEDLYVPVGPSEWLTSDPDDGTYYRSFNIGDVNDETPVFFC